MSAAGRIDARHLARSPLLWIGGLLGLVTPWYLDGLGRRPVLAGDDESWYGAALVLGGAALLAGAWLGLRDHLSGTDDLVGVAPTAPWRVLLTRMAAVGAVAAVLFLALFAGGLAQSAARGGGGTPSLRLAADGTLSVVLSAWVGLALGRFTRSRLVCLFAAPAWVTLSFARMTGARRLAPVLISERRSVALGFLPDPYWAHLPYLTGLVVAVGVGAVLLARIRVEPRALPWPLAAAGAAGVAVSVAAAGWLVALPDNLLWQGPGLDDWVELSDTIPDRIEPYPDDGLATACARAEGIEVCVYPAFGLEWAQARADALAPVTGPLAGLPGVVSRVRMVPSVASEECAGDELQVSEHAGFDDPGEAFAVYSFLECMLPSSGYSSLPLGNVDEDEELEATAEAVVAEWVRARIDEQHAQRLTTVAPEEEARARMADFVQIGYSDPEELRAMEGEVVEALLAARAMLALPPEQVGRELAPLWDRLRAGELTVDELPRPPAGAGDMGLDAVDASRPSAGAGDMGLDAVDASGPSAGAGDMGLDAVDASGAP